MIHYMREPCIGVSRCWHDWSTEFNINDNDSTEDLTDGVFDHYDDHTSAVADGGGDATGHNPSLATHRYRDCELATIRLYDSYVL